MLILFQGDSITDAGRDRRNYHNMGSGYPKFAAEKIAAAFPELNPEFINLAISGSRTHEVFDRLYPDTIAFSPDYIFLMIGINDIWHRYGGNRIATTDEQIEVNFRSILTELRAKTHARIIVLAPYLLDYPGREQMKEDLARVLPVMRDLAERYADVYVPLDQQFEEAMKTQPEPLYYSRDGVHPNENGARFIGERCFEAIKPLLDAASASE